jgi:hypothetical protein
MPRSEAQHADRLRGIEQEIAAGLNIDLGAANAADRQRIRLGSVLRLQLELRSAEVVSGQQVSSDELLRLSEAAAAILPLPVPQPIEVEICKVYAREEPPPQAVQMMRERQIEAAASTDPVVRALREEIAALRAELVRAHDALNEAQRKNGEYERRLPTPSSFISEFAGGPRIGGDPVAQANRSMSGAFIGWHDPHGNRGG